MSVDNNQASTKAYLDALALSQPGDVLEVLHLVGSTSEERVKAEMLQRK